MATVRDFIRQLQKLPQHAQILIEDVASGGLLPPVIQTRDEVTIVIATASQSAGDRLQLERREREMHADGDPFDES